MLTLAMEVPAGTGMPTVMPSTLFVKQGARMTALPLMLGVSLFCASRSCDRPSRHDCAA